MSCLYWPMNMLPVQLILLCIALIFVKTLCCNLCDCYADICLKEIHLICRICFSSKYMKHAKCLYTADQIGGGKVIYQISLIHLAICPSVCLWPSLNSAACLKVCPSIDETCLICEGSISHVVHVIKDRKLCQIFNVCWSSKICIFGQCLNLIPWMVLCPCDGNVKFDSWPEFSL